MGDGASTKHFFILFYNGLLTPTALLAANIPKLQLLLTCDVLGRLSSTPMVCVSQVRLWASIARLADLRAAA
jgi:hypothetical protein